MTITTPALRTAAPVRVDALDVERIRADFPILQRKIYGKRLVYLDSAATTQKPEQVIRAMSNHYRQSHANVHRGIYALSAEATDLYEGARLKVAQFIGAPATEQIIFTRNATESINLVAHAWGTPNLKAGDEILLTEMEHHSNLVPWYLLAKRTGAVVRHIPIDADGLLDLDRGYAMMTEKTRIVAFTHTSNVLGTINPVAEIIRRAHARGAIVLVDAAQGVPHTRVDVAELDPDFLAFSAHKMLGPSGVGVLYGRRKLLEDMDPFLGGGDMISNVTLTGASWNELPWKFEAGTPNIANVIGFGAAIDYLNALGMDRIRQHEMDLTTYAMERLQESGDIEIYGPRDPSQRAGVIAFNERNVHPHDLATILDREGIAIRAGHHCAQPLMSILGQSATARVSFYVHNDRRDIDALMAGLTCAGRFFGRR
jgi:cysteine desulfurase/selenocysteine lyase